MASIAVSIGVVAALAVPGRRERDAQPEVVPTLRLEDIPFDGARAYEYLKQITAIGPRPSGSEGMEAQQRLLVDHFQKLGARVEHQRFRAQHPANRSEVPMANLIVQWHPDRRERVLVCAHYDTLPFPMRDPEDPKGVFVGANDGASGVAVLMELGREMARWPSAYGVDFVLFDGEEFIFREQDPFFLGSRHFARTYAASRPPHRYHWGVLLDMVGHAELQLYQERNSVRWRDTRPLVDRIWGIAARLGVREFSSQVGFEVRDDHLALHDIARIPTCDIIDFDYPPWHTQGDTPDKCSAISLAKVGWVVGEWLKTLEAPNE